MISKKKIQTIILTFILFVGALSIGNVSTKAYGGDSHIWISRAAYNAIEGATPMGIGVKTDFVLTSEGNKVYALFAPTETASYNFYIQASYSTDYEFYIYNGMEATSRNREYSDYYNYGDTDHDCKLNAGTIYLLELYSDDFEGNDTGTISLTIRPNISSISFDDTEVTIIGSGNMKALTPVVLPSVAQAMGLTWVSNNPAIASVDDNGVVTALATGSTTVFAMGWTGEGASIKVNVLQPSVDLDKVSYENYIGKSVTLKAVGSGCSVKNVKYSSANKSVASVDSKGKVTLKQPGKTKIKAVITTDIGQFTKECSVQVYPPYLNKTYAFLYRGKATKLKVKHSTGKMVWSSSKPQVCSVDSRGKVTAKKKGTAVIKCLVNGVTLKCKVTVYNPYLSQQEMELTNGYKYEYANCLYVYDGKSSTKGVWSSSNPSVATVKKGVVTTKKPGNTTITCKLNGYTMKCKVHVYSNVYEDEAGKIDDLQFDRIYYQVVKEYFEKGKLKVKLKIFNTYTDRDIKNIKSITISQYSGNNSYVTKRFVNYKVNLKPYSAKTFVFTIAKVKDLNKRIDLRSGSHASVSILTDYYNYEYTY